MAYFMIDVVSPNRVRLQFQRIGCSILAIESNSLTNLLSHELTHSGKNWSASDYFIAPRGHPTERLGFPPY